MSIVTTTFECTAHRLRPSARPCQGLPRRRQRAVMTLKLSVGLCAIVGLLTSCASGPTVVAGTATETVRALSPSASQGASPSAAASSGSASAPANCQDLAKAATAIMATVADLSLLVGTHRDATALLADVGDFAPVLGGLVPACHPGAEDSMWRFLTSAEEMRQQFSSGTGKTEMGASKLELIAVRAQGADLYLRLGLDSSGWSTVPANARLACQDLDRIGAAMTWEVRHLANLIGSDNEKDSQGYLVGIAGLTSALADLVAECGPQARMAMAKFASAVEQLSVTYRPGTDPSVVEADIRAFGDLRAKGISLYSSLGINTTGWKVIPATER